MRVIAQNTFQVQGMMIIIVLFHMTINEELVRTTTHARQGKQKNGNVGIT
jgi:hypothetical protein